MKLSVKFLGGTADNGNLTGSCTLLKIKQKKTETNILVDTGLWQGKQEQSLERNKNILKNVDPRSITAVVLTHSHIDHIGRLPFLAKNGFQGRVYCTKPTADILGIMLEDSAKIMESEAKYLRRKLKETGAVRPKQNQKKSPGHKPKGPKALFTCDDVTETLQQIKNNGYDYRQWIRLDHNVYLQFYPSGHVLGGAICVIRVDRKKKKQTFLGFSGDLGRKDGIILPPPAEIKIPIHYWFTESTYGGITHPPRDEEINTMLDLIRQAARTNGKILIPSFALERTQEILYLLSYYMSIGIIPEIPIYLDSPLATKITHIFSRYWDTKMFKGQEILDFNPFNRQNIFLKAIVDDFKSVEISKSPGPYLLIAGSGMCDAGRIRNHLRENLGNKNTTVCLVGYMTEGSLGSKLKEGMAFVKMNGQEIEVKANVVSFNSLSAHADGPFLVEFTSSLINSKKNDSSIFILHGDEKSGLSLKRDLLNNFTENNGEWKKNIILPNLNETIDLLSDLS
jgi:metallo-beta-lactamase family protein